MCEMGIECVVVYKLVLYFVLFEKMLFLLIKGGIYGKWVIFFGLLVYDFLVGVERDDWRKMFFKK